jgi:hypothetical protein
MGERGVEEASFELGVVQCQEQTYQVEIFPCLVISPSSLG